MADFLLELFSEEIPARMQAEAIAHVQKTLTGQLQKEGVSLGDTATFVTPRRLAIIINDLPVMQEASETELKGPKTNAPEAALQGFLKKNTLTNDNLIERDGVYFAIVKKTGRSTADILKTIIEAMLASFPWPKSMRWGGDATWVRPLHSILCIFDGKTVPVTFAGLTAGNTTQGHRFLSHGAITISSPKDYEAALENAFVIADRDKRKASISQQAETIAAAKGLQLKKDDGLLEEVTGLVEYPVVLAGVIDAKFMDLPKEVLISEMRAHQKYFALENKDGTLSDTFLITANMKTGDNGQAIVAGNERVLRARLSDGRFFWDQDRKKTLAQWAEGLKTVTYHAKLGTIADKVARIETLALQLADILNADKALVQQAARLCKADLVTGMVGEFPELQGVMGRYYALAQKENPAVADAIRDHYKPQGPSDAVPTNRVAICVALADKLDTLISMFAIGEKPTGSKDPFALRRAALGIIRIILDNNLRLPLTVAILMRGRTPQQLRDDIVEFFIDRLKVQLKDSGIREGVIKAVVANGDDDLVRIKLRAEALQQFLDTDDGINLLAAYKRAANILSIEEKKDAVKYNSQIDKQLLKEKAEIELFEKIGTTLQQFYTLRAKEDFQAAMKLLAELRAPVDQFFDNIMVNCEDKKLRSNRLLLLSLICNAVDTIAVFALIEGDSKEQKKAA